ncbi:MAG: 50S ribosomal protein L32e [Candidatus Bathyarchaeum sp.]|nr:MAG: 50S ribosomal protein L32e [Candidatus Bathyarchaeum sp.]
MSIEEHEPIEEKQSSKKGYVKHKTPKFRRQESWRYKRVPDKWRKPHGVDSKMRKKVKGWPACPTTGYQSPKKTRGLHPSGFVETRVHTVEDLAGIDPELQAVLIARRVGGRKRVEILALAAEKGIHVLNPRTTREPEEFTEGAEPEETKSPSKGENKS